MTLPLASRSFTNVFILSYKIVRGTSSKYCSARVWNPSGNLLSFAFGYNSCKDQECFSLSSSVCKPAFLPCLTICVPFSGHVDFVRDLRNVHTLCFISLIMKNSPFVIISDAPSQEGASVESGKFSSGIIGDFNTDFHK